MKFWDSSALVALVIEEASTVAVEYVAARDSEMALWWGARVECRSAVARRARDGGFPVDEALRASADLELIVAEGSETPPSETLRKLACELVDRHPLRAADALQLAAAVTARAGSARPMEFVCLDQRLRQAAEREGFAVLPV